MMRRTRHGFGVVAVSIWGLLGFSGCGDAPPATPVAKAPAATIESTAGIDREIQPAAAEDVDQTRTASGEPIVIPTSDAVIASTDKSVDAGKKSAEAAKPLFDGWTNPAVVIVFSGEQHGHLEPCGCSENQAGGIARRHDLVKQIQAREWPVTALDLGGTINRSRLQSKLKFQTFLAAMKDMHYSVLNLGPEELKLGAAELLAAHTPDEKNLLGSLGFLSANVTLFDSPDLGTPVRSKLLTLGAVRIGVTSVLGAGFRKEITPEGANVDITIADPAAALPAVLKDLESQKPDLLVLLSHGTLAEAGQLIKKFPQFHVILTAGGVEDPLFDNPQKIGDTLLVQVGHKGKFTGVLGFFPNDPQQRLRYELIKLTDERFQDSQKMVEHMRLYQDLLKDANLVASESPINHPSGAKFVGSEKCGECHTKAFAIWEKTGHAHAYDSLINGRPRLKNRWVPRIHDPECLACHVTGWHPQEALRYISGFESAKKTPEMLHNGCENCHGPGSRHIQLIDAGDKEAARKEVRLTLADAKKTHCYSCHDLDNDPKFGSATFDAYWKKIEHKGLD